MIQRVLTDAPWSTTLGVRDLAALNPLLYHHINPYGIFDLDLDARLPLEDYMTTGVPAT
jgi:hypothetical protein